MINPIKDFPTPVWPEYDQKLRSGGYVRVAKGGHGEWTHIGAARGPSVQEIGRRYGIPYYNRNDRRFGFRVVKNKP